MRKLILVLILTFVSGTCFQAAARANQQQQLSVRIHQQKRLARRDLTVRFVSLVEDSRCPVDTNCVWAGNAKIKILAIRRNGSSRIFELNTNLKPQIVTYAGYQFKLIDLTPKPATNIRINPNGYTATFSVSKAAK
jgi:hypothetical protein